MYEREVDIVSINEQAITDGFLLPGRESLQNDFSPKLGKKLSMTELRCYEVINKATIEGPITAQGISKRLSGRKKGLREDTIMIWINRIRNKLGYESIVNIPGAGYQSRRVLIDKQAEKNQQVRKPGKFYLVSGKVDF
jgi:hypothetical protein